MQWVAVGIFTKKLGLMVVMALTVSLAHAFTGNNQTNIFDAVVTNFPSGYGGGYWGDVCIVRNGGKLFVTGAGFVGGWGVEQSNNVAYISDAGSVWTNSSFMVVGGSGKGNQMTITNGGFVTSTGATIGHSLGSDNNTVLVDGTGSVWSNSVDVGLSGAGNQLTIGNGGKVYGSINRIGFGSASVDASNNTVLVTGAGSVWSGTSLLTIGGYGSGNQLAISNGGVVYGTSVTIGTYSNNNTGLVTGSGSVWSNSAGLTIGSVGAGNRLTITNGGKVYSTGGGVLGAGAASSNNTVLVTGMDSVWSNSGVIYVGSSGSSNQLNISSGGRMYSSGTSYIACNANSSNNSVRVTGTGSLWSNNGEIQVGGLAGTGNQLTIAGGDVIATSVRLPGSNNTVLVSGGSLEANTLVIAASMAGTVISNSGGIYQFTVAAPTITPNLGSIAINGGTVSFRDIQSGTLPKLTDNWTDSNLRLMAWSGTNTLRLNNSFATNALANSYIFYTGNGPTNYAGFELINGTNVVKGKGITIESTGSLLVSNTLATFVGVVTNNSAKVNLAGPSTITASNGIVWAAGSAATTTAGTVTFDAYTSNRFDSGTVTLCQFAATATQIVNGVVWGPGNLLKSGPGVLILAASNLYTGATTVSNGTLLVNGSVTGAVTVVSGAKLGGAGTVYGAVTNSGTFTAAITDSIGGATLLNVSGNLVLQAGSQLVLTGTNYLVGSSASYTIIQTTGGSVSGTFANDTAILPRGWRISYSGNAVKVMPGYPGTLFMIQ
jgi:T5SS/PEP-CTERM-associated repeat protein